MKQFYILLIVLSMGFNLDTLVAQIIWTGPKTTFTKADGADWTQPANQDRITPNVWITRANNQGIFNIKIESNFDGTNRDSPKDTEWAFGTTSNIATLTFKNWADTIDNLPLLNMLNNDMVLHLITDNIYIDIKFLSWTSGGTGGGFSYERSTDQTLSVDDFALNNTVKIHPNPASNIINLLNVEALENYTIFNILGVKVAEGTIGSNNTIDIQQLKSGIYIVQLKNGKALRFVKK